MFLNSPELPGSLTHVHVVSIDACGDGPATSTIYRTLASMCEARDYIILSWLTMLVYMMRP